MPDWLRIGIINGLQPPQRDLIRRIQAAMMAQVETDQKDAGSTALDQLVAKFEVARALSPVELDEVTSRVGRQNVLNAEERIFFSVLNDERLDPVRDVIHPEAPEIVADRMDAPERRRRFLLRVTVVGVAALAALMQPWVYIVMTWFGGATGAFLDWTANLFNKSQGLVTASSDAAAALMLLSMALWLYNMLRSESQTSSNPDSRSYSLGRVLSDPRWPAIIACLLFIFFLEPSIIDRASRVRVDVNGRMLLFAATGVLAWVWIVTPARWWNKTSADAMLTRQLQRETMTGSLGTLAVVAIWAIPWFLGVLPTLAKPDNSIESLLLAALIGASASAASNALMRRWLLGNSHTISLERIWLDLAFAGLNFLLLAVAMRAPEKLQPLILYGSAQISIVAYYVATRANLGIRGGRSIWRPILNATLVATIVLTAIGPAAFFWFHLLGYLPSDVIEYAAICAFDAFGVALLVGQTIFALARQGSPHHRMAWISYAKRMLPVLALSIAANAAYVFQAASFFVDATISSVSAVFGVLPQYNANLFAVLLWVFLLPMIAAFWPVFGRAGSATLPDHVEASPWWRDVAASPWWGTLAMWLAAVGWRVTSPMLATWFATIGWHVGSQAFCFWPLSLLIAVALAWKFGTRATAATAAGTLPLILRTGDSTDFFLTPGGVWPALVILFWSRFVIDESLRQRLLRRESLPWAEAGLMAVMLAARVDFSFPLGATTGTIHIDPEWMAMTVAFVIGASRMPAWRFAVALAVVWGATEILSILRAPDPTHGPSAGLKAGELASLLLVLYVARAWLSRTKSAGFSLATATALIVTVLASGFIPTVELGRIEWKLLPSTAGALALVLVSGMWTGREAVPYTSLNFYVRFIAPVFRHVPVLVLSISAAAYLFLFAYQIGPAALRNFGVGISRAHGVPSDLNTIGFVVCCLAFAAFGAAVRIVAERRAADSSWRESARRLWSAPTNASRFPTPGPGILSQAPDQDRDFDKSAA